MKPVNAKEYHAGLTKEQWDEVMLDFLCTGTAAVHVKYDGTCEVLTPLEVNTLQGQSDVQRRRKAGQTS